MQNQTSKLKNSFKQRVKAPWHLWVLGIFFIYLYSNGIYDLLMMLGHNSTYYNSKNYGNAVMAYFTNYPLIPLIFWIAHLASGLISSILLFFRSHWAVQISLISIISIILQDFLTFAFRNRWLIFGPWISIFDIVIILMTFGLFLYCKAMAKGGILK